jgi:hypothetical protein
MAARFRRHPDGALPTKDKEGSWHKKRLRILDVLLTVHNGTSVNQHQLDTLSLVCFIKSQSLYMFRALLAILQNALV